MIPGRGRPEPDRLEPHLSTRDVNLGNPASVDRSLCWTCMGKLRTFFGVRGQKRVDERPFARSDMSRERAGAGRHRIRSRPTRKMTKRLEERSRVRCCLYGSAQGVRGNAGTSACSPHHVRESTTDRSVPPVREGRHGTGAGNAPAWNARGHRVDDSAQGRREEREDSVDGDRFKGPGSS